MRMYVKWSWLFYMATAMWSSLIINDWNHDFQNDNIMDFKVNKTVKDVDETIYTISKTQPTINRQGNIEENPYKEPSTVIDPYKSVKIDVPTKEYLKIKESLAPINDTPIMTVVFKKQDEKESTKSSFEILDDLNLIFKLLDGSATCWTFNWYWNCIAFIVLTLIYIFGKIFWKFGQNQIPKENESNLLEKKSSLLNITKSLTQQKKILSKIPTYKFKRSISEMVVSSINHPQTTNCELVNVEISNLNSITIKNNNLIKEINDYKKKLKDEEEMCFNLRQELIHIHDEHERDHDNLNRKLEAVSIEKKELSKQLATVLKENTTLHNDLDEITLSKDNTTRKLSRIKEELRKSTKEKCNLNKQIIVMRKQNVNLHQTLERCRREMKQHQEKIQELEREILQLKTRLQCATIINKKNGSLKDNSEDLLKTINGVNEFKTPGKLNPTKLSKLDIYTDVKSRIRNLENNIVNWETKNNDKKMITTHQDDFQISEIFHTCCDNSNDDSSEYGLTTDAFYSDQIVAFYREEEFQATFTESTTTTTSDDATTSLQSGQLNNSDDLININDPAFETNFNEEYNRLMEKLQQSDVSSESKGIITKQTTFLRKYFQDTSNIQDGFNYFSNDIETVLNNNFNLSNKCRVSVQVCPENSNNVNNRQDTIIQNSLTYKLLSNFDSSWQGGSMPISPTSVSNKTLSSPESCNDTCEENTNLYSLD